jgi:hypothetical protein
MGGASRANRNPIRGYIGRASAIIGLVWRAITGDPSRRAHFIQSSVKDHDAAAEWIDDEHPNDRPGLIEKSRFRSARPDVGDGTDNPLTVIGDAVVGLSRLSNPSPPVMREIWLLTHPELRYLRRIKVTVDWHATTIGVAKSSE